MTVVTKPLPNSAGPTDRIRIGGADRNRLRRSWLPSAVGGSVALLGALALLGWLVDVAAMRAEMPSVLGIQPSEAIFYFWSGLALAFLAKRPAHGIRRIAGAVCACLAVIWTAVLFVEFGVAVAGAPHLNIAELASLTEVQFEGSATVWDLLLYGCLAAAPFLLNARRYAWLGELLVLVPLAISFLGLVGEAFRLIAPPGSERDSVLPAVLLGLLLEIGLLAARPQRGWMGILTGSGLGGSLARWLLPIAVLVPFVFAWLRQVAEQAGLIDKVLGGTLYALLIVFVQSILIMWYAATVNRTDRKRQGAEDFVRALLRTGARLNSTLDVDSLLTILASEAARLVGAESALAGLRTAEGVSCRRYIHHGKPLAYPYHWPEGTGLPGWVAQNKLPYRTNDPDADPLIDPQLRERFDVRSAVGAPILDARSEVLGFVEVHNKPGGFTDADQNRLLALTQSATSAIQNALAYSHLEEAEQALKAADRHKDEFLATLAHELRNPLAPLRNGLQIIRLAGDDRQAVEQSRTMMERQLSQMVRLIDDLLDLSRISRGKIELRKQPMLLADAVQQAVETSRPAIEQAGHRLTVELPMDPLFVDADVTRLAQVFANLLNNAAKFTAAGGDIHVTVTQEDREAVVRVRDNGVGIPAEMLPRVFDMFTQVDRSLERTQGGLGIGLSLVKGLIDLHEGKVEAVSAGAGMGSEFVVRLPLIAPPSAASPAPSNEVFRSSGHRVLVVDDNRDAADSLAMLLTSWGNQTRTVHDGLAALEVGADFRPDVVLLDIGMPRMNGYDTARRIRNEPWGQDVRLVALTGWGQDDARRKSREAGFDHHAVKPVELATLAQLLKG